MVVRAFWRVNQSMQGYNWCQYITVLADFSNDDDVQLQRQANAATATEQRQ